MKKLSENENFLAIKCEDLVNLSSVKGGFDFNRLSDDELIKIAETKIFEEGFINVDERERLEKLACNGGGTGGCSILTHEPTIA